MNEDVYSVVTRYVRPKDGRIIRHVYGPYEMKDAARERRAILKQVEAEDAVEVTVVKLISLPPSI